MTVMTRRSMLLSGAAATGIVLFSRPSDASAAPSDISGASGRTEGAEVSGVNEIVVAAGEALTLSQTIQTRRLVIVEGGTVAAPDGYSLTMTVDGVETGQAITVTGGTISAIAAGCYQGNVVLTVAEANLVEWNGLTFPFRQALYIDATGVVAARSALSAVVGGRVGSSEAAGISIQSTGEVFNGVYVTDGLYTIKNPDISFTGNGRCDFVGHGAAIMGTGSGTTLVVDGAFIDNAGVVRTGVIANDGANLVVKNSTIHTEEGELPADYVDSVYPMLMQAAPWMLGISGNVRATNVLGSNTRATYLNSRISSAAWGALSTDSGTNMRLTAINCEVVITGESGYGSYADGSAIDRFLGTTFDVPSYAVIATGGELYFMDSTGEAVSTLNSALELGLTSRELASIPARSTVVDSRRFGVMWHGSGAADICGGTIFNTAGAVFLNKGKTVTITVDGSQGAQLNSGNGIIMQMMENDDPGPVMVDGISVNEGVYTEPTGFPTRVDSFDIAAVHDTDTRVTLSSISLRGDFYNGMRGGESAAFVGMNLVLTLNSSTVQGVVSASTTEHAVSTITKTEYLQLGEVTNTVGEAVNNGVLVILNSGSRWIVADTSYVTRLTIAADAVVAAPRGRSVTMTVDGVATEIAQGTSYSGSIIITVS